MAKATRGRRGLASRNSRATPYPLPSHDETNSIQKHCAKYFKKDWENTTCSVCMEFPHNAVLLLCSSHEKGCRPYMCGTSSRHSNCLDQYKKAYTKVNPLHNHPLHGQPIGPFTGPCEAQKIACPLCRGQVKGWTIVEPAREHLNAKKRNCMQDNCPFIGTYKELKRHVRAEHPSIKPREVDPTVEQKWRRLEQERERDGVMSTIRSSMPGAVFFGDYVVDRNNYDVDSDDEEEGFDADSLERNEGMEVGIERNLISSVFLFLQAFGSTGNAGRQRGPIDETDDDDEDEGNYGNSPAGGLSREGRVVLGRSRRRRRRREVNGSGDDS